MRKLILIVALVLAIPTFAFAGSPPICERVCTVQSNDGGVVTQFEATGHQIHSSHKLLRIDGFCGSACMTMASFARPHVCITPNASFGYHRTNFGRELPLSSDLRHWVHAHGGFPAFGGSVGIMDYQNAKTFFPACGV